MSREDGRCPFCGNTLNPSSPICPSCGRNILDLPTDAPEREKIHPRPPSIALTPRNLLLGGILLVLILVLPFIAFLSWSRSNQPAPIVKTIIVQNTPVPTSPAASTTTSTPGSMPTQTSTSSQPSGSVLCQADWSSGMNGWAGSPEWKVVNGKLVSDGTDTGVNVAPTGSDSVMAPCQLSTPNYAVDAKMQIIDTPNNCYLQIRGRVQPDGSAYDGYVVGYDSYFGDAMIGFFSPNAGFSPIKSAIYSPALEEHTYRAEFRDNQITLKIDQQFVLQVIDNKFINSGQVGLENGGCQISVSSFQVVAL